MKCLQDTLEESKSAYAGLEAAATNANRMHRETHTAMEEEFVAWASTLKSELHGVVAAGHAVCQAAYLQPEVSGSGTEVASQLVGILTGLEEIAQLGLSVGAQIALLVTVGAIYADLDIGSVRGKPPGVDPAVVEALCQRAVEPAETLIANVDLSVVIRDSLPDLSEDDV